MINTHIPSYLSLSSPYPPAVSLYLCVSVCVCVCVSANCVHQFFQLLVCIIMSSSALRALDDIESRRHQETA